MSPFGRCRADGAAGRGGMAFPRRTHAFLHFPQLYTIMAVSSSGNIFLLHRPGFFFVCQGHAADSTCPHTAPLSHFGHWTRTDRQSAALHILRHSWRGFPRTFAFCAGGFGQYSRFWVEPVVRCYVNTPLLLLIWLCRFGRRRSGRGDLRWAEKRVRGGRTDNLLKSAVKFL